MVTLLPPIKETPFSRYFRPRTSIPTTGGMTTIGGEQVLVTPGGEQVGSAEPTFTRGGGSGGGGGGGSSYRPKTPQERGIIDLPGGGTTIVPTTTPQPEPTQEVVERPSVVKQFTRPETTGGMTTLTGGSVIVTPEGKEVKSTIRPGTTNEGGGLFFLTPEESREYKGREPVFQIESQTPSDAITEGKWASLVMPSTYKPPLIGTGISSGQFESNIQQIEAAKKGFRFEKEPSKFIDEKGVVGMSTEEGSSYELKPEFFDIPVSKARERFEGLPTGERVKGQVSEMEVGFLKFGAGTGKFIGEWPLQATTRVGTGEELKRTSIFPEDKELMQVPVRQKSVGFLESPGKYTKELILERPATTMPIVLSAGLGAGMVKGWTSNVKQFGFKTGSAETIVGASPIQLASKRSYLNVEREFFDTGMTRTGEIKFEGGTYSAMGGTTASGIKMGSIQMTRGVKGGSIGTSTTTIETPYIEYVGGKFVRGTETKSFSNIFAAKPRGKYGYTAEVTTKDLQTGKITYDIQKGIRQPYLTKDNVELFTYAGGKKVQGADITQRSIVEDIKIDSFSGFRPTIKGGGTSIDIRGVRDTKDIKIIGGGGKPKTVTTSEFVTPQVTGIKQDVVLTKPTINTKAFTPIKGDFTRTTMKTITKTTPTTTLKIDLLEPKTKSISTSLVQTPMVQQDFTKVSPLISIRPAISSLPKEKVGITNIQMPKIKITENSREVYEPLIPPPTGITQPGYGFNYKPIPFTPFIPPMLPMPGIGAGTGRKRRVKTKRKLRRTPSFAAAQLGFTTPKPLKFEETGLIERPLLRKKKRRKK